MKISTKHWVVKRNSRLKIRKFWRKGGGGEEGGTEACRYEIDGLVASMGGTNGLVNIKIKLLTVLVKIWRIYSRR